MAHTARLDLKWDSMAHALLAWHAVRLNAEYRRDWENNQRYLDWLNLHPMECDWERLGGTQVISWLKNIAWKWDFECGPWLPSPHVAIPGIVSSKLAKLSKAS